MTKSELNELDEKCNKKLDEFATYNRGNKLKTKFLKEVSKDQTFIEITPETKQFLINKYNLDENITFHSLRHSFASNFIKAGGDPFVLKSTSV